MEKAISITYSESVLLALVIQHAMRMRHIVICACPDLQYFSTLSHTLNSFRKKNEPEMCALIIISATFVSNISHSKKK